MGTPTQQPTHAPRFEGATSKELLAALDEKWIIDIMLVAVTKHTFSQNTRHVVHINHLQTGDITLEEALRTIKNTTALQRSVLVKASKWREAHSL